MECYRKIVVLRNEIEAQLMEQVLQERGIPFVVKSYHDSAYDGLFQFQKGWGHIASLPEYKDEIEAIYREVAAGSHLDDANGSECS